MIAAHFKPSDEVLKEIEQATKCYLCRGDLNTYGSARYNICTKICKEAGIDNPTKDDLVGAIPAFNYHAQKIIDKYLEEKYRNENRAEQETTGCGAESC